MASIDHSRTGMRDQNGIADLIVKGAIALVTAAFFIGAYLQFQVAFWLALIAALSVYIALLMLHALMRRSERVDTLVSEVSRLEGEVARLKGHEEYAPPTRGAQPRGTGPAKPPAPKPPAATGPRFEPKAQPSAPDASFELKVQPSAPDKEPQLASRKPPLTAPLPSSAAHYASPSQAGGPQRLEPSPTLPSWPTASPGPGPGPEPMHDYWSFRPVKQTLPEGAQPRRDEAVPAAAERETDLAAVQGMIKRLADELNLGVDAGKVSDPASQETVVRASVDALHATADTMRATAPKAPPAAARQDHRQGPPPVPPPIAPGHSRLSSVGAAVAASRMEVFLEPIVGLADHRVHHYEITVRPRDEKGSVLALAAHDPQLSRTGLLPLLDSARLKRAALLSRAFAEDGHKCCVFAAASAESLATDRFLDELANAYRRRQALAGELVLTFSQADIRTFGGTEWSALTDMRDLGFRFGLEAVSDLDYEFTALKAAGFAFVKLDAARLLSGLPGPAGNMSAAQVARHLGELGLFVIVGRVNDESTRAKILQAGVPLAQGRLFGPPMPVPDAPAGSGTAAA